MMAFLHRRPSRPQLSESFRFPSLPFHWLDDSPNTTGTPIIPPNADLPRSSRLIRRVSSIFSPRKKRNRPPNSEPVSNIAVRRRSDCQASDRTASLASLDDIRPPSGLGFSVDITNPLALALASNISLPSPSGEHTAFNGISERLRCISSPEMLRSNSGLMRERPSISRQDSPLVSSSRTSDSVSFRNPINNIPPEVLDVIFSFLHRHTIASLATVSKKFSTAVRRKLYEKLDLSSFCSDRLERVSKLLGSRWDLADMVHTLICDTWPPSPPPPSITRLSFLPCQAPPFSVALHNMHHLTSLTLPSFDGSILRDRTTFRLKQLTFLTHTMSPDQQTELFLWLTTQSDIVSLSFPNLVEPANVNKDLPIIPYDDLLNAKPDSSVDLHNNEPIPHDNLTLRQHVHHELSTNLILPRFDNFSPSFLPALTSLHAPLTLTTLLAPTRPLLTDITIHIRTNLDTGLRPTALMTAIRGVTTLGFRFGVNVDKRSVEKVLRAAAAALGDECQSLDVQVGWLVSDESLYKIAHAVLPRFHVLHTLRLRRVAHPSIVSVMDTSTPPSSEQGHHSAPTPIGANGPDVAAKADNENENKNEDLKEDKEMSHLHEDERAHLESWLKHCANLGTVEFLSRKIWHEHDGLGQP